MSRDERRELVTLVSWVQTFQEFVYTVVDGNDNDNDDERYNLVIESLQNPKISM